MTNAVSVYRFFIIISCLCVLPAAIQAQTSGADIFLGEKLAKGLNLGVDTSKHEKGWFSNNKKDGHFNLDFPSNQDWSAVFITVGPPRNRLDDRRFRDYSQFKTLSVDMKGSAGGERIEIGIKSREQEDDGSETKIPVTLTSEWQTYQFSLDNFKQVNLKELYVVAEFVYTCPKQQSVQIRNIRYLKEETTRPEMGGTPCEPTQGDVLDILAGTKLSGGFGLGVDSSEQKRDWVGKKEGEFMTLSFPSDQDWSVAFFTVGSPNQRMRDGRQSRDLSMFRFLEVEMKGAVGQEELEIGIKTNTQDDDGSETKIPVKLNSEWTTYSFALDRFVGANPGKLYVVAEFVYAGSKPQTVFVRNIRYRKTATKEGQTSIRIKK
jgi:hypothetical protein